MEIRFSVTAEDWENAVRLAPRSAWNTWQFVLSFSPVGTVGLIVLTSRGDTAAGLVLLGISFAIAFAGYEIPRMGRRRVLRSTPQASEERVYKIDQEGIAASTSFFKVQYEWQAFTSYRETDSLFVLFTSPHQVGPWFPKRGLSPEQIAELRQLFKTRLPKR